MSGLRIGVLIDGDALPAWVIKTLQTLQSSPYAEIALIVSNKNDTVSSARTSAQLQWRLHHLLYLAYRKIDSKLSTQSGSPFTAKEMPACLDQVDRLNVIPQCTQYCDRFNEDDVNAIKAKELDVILRFGFRILKGEILAAAKYGVWSFHHGDNRVNHGGPSGFWEVMLGEATSGVTLQVLSEELDAGTVLHREICKTDSLLVDRSRTNMYWQSIGIVTSKLRQLHMLGEEAFFSLAKAQYTAQSFYSSPLYKAPKNSSMVGLIVSHLIRYCQKKLAFQFSKRQWALFYQFSAKQGATQSLWRFKELKSPSDRFWADPFVVFTDNRYFIFFEELVFSENKGYLSVLELHKDGSYSKPIKILEQDTHLSWPHVFEFEGKWYMVPESSRKQHISLYRCSSFPEQWEFEKTLLSNITAVDPTIVFHDDRWWMFAVVREFKEGNLQNNLFLWYADNPVSGEWIPHVLNPIVSDVSSARSAGRLFTQGDALFRPSQNCSEGYGRSIKINRVDVLNVNEYRETCIEEIKPNWRGDIIATHSLSTSGELTMVDAQKSRSLFAIASRR